MQSGNIPLEHTCGGSRGGDAGLPGSKFWKRTSSSSSAELGMKDPSVQVSSFCLMFILYVIGTFHSPMKAMSGLPKDTAAKIGGSLWNGP